MSFPASCFGEKDHAVFTYINEWEKHSIAKIQEAAEQVRLDLKELLATRSGFLLRSIKQTTEEMKSASADANVDVWTRTWVELQQEVTDMSSRIHLEHDRRKSPICFIRVSDPRSKQTENHPRQDGDLISVPGTPSITKQALQQAAPKEQQQLFGERLFLLVQQIEPSLAAKITGMFLEWDSKYLFILLQSPHLPETKVIEAMGVLQMHRRKQVDNRDTVYTRSVLEDEKKAPLVSIID